MEHRFDELAKELARGLSRREALRRLGGGLAAALLAPLVSTRAWGDGEGNSLCAHFCQSIFPPGPQRGECISAAAHGEGPCYEYGPMAPQEPLCLLESGEEVRCGPGTVCGCGMCYDLSSVTCCPGEMVVCATGYACLSRGLASPCLLCERPVRVPDPFLTCFPLATCVYAPELSDGGETCGENEHCLALCRPNGSPCSDYGDCCSGVCQSGACGACADDLECVGPQTCASGFCLGDCPPAS